MSFTGLVIVCAVLPELHWAYDYPVTMGFMIIACVSLFIGFKRSGWL